MRAYSFTNFYLSSIQQGIQPAHAIVEMFVKYKNHVQESKHLFDWATNHKTMICLNGGTSADIRDLYFELIHVAEALQLPYSPFNEDEASLDGALTSVAIIVPEKIYMEAAEMRDRDYDPTTSLLNPAETQLAKILNRYSLAK